MDWAQRPVGNLPYISAPPRADNSPSLYYNSNNNCSPYGCREDGWRGNHSGPANWPEQDPAQNPCHPGYSVYGVDDFRDVPVYFSQVLRHNVELEPLAMVFSSATNAYRIHREISRIIFEQTQINIAKQDNAVLAAVMAEAFRGYRVRYKRNDIHQDVTYLNSLVIEGIAPRALANLKAQIAYLPLIDKVQTGPPNPVLLSQRGLDGRSAYDLGRFLP